MPAVTTWMLRVWLVSSILLVVSLILYIFLTAHGKTRSKLQAFVGGLLVLSVYVTFIALVLSITVFNPNLAKVTVPTLARFFEWSIRTVGLALTQLIIASIVLALGIGAFFFKRWKQDWYGIVEVCIGFLSALFVAGTLAPTKLDLAKWATLAGCAYVVARGLSNYSETKNKKVPMSSLERALSANP